MPVRKALKSELPAMAQVAAEAFWDDEFLGVIMHPKRNEFPLDVHLTYLKKFEAAWRSPHNYFFVATVPGQAGGEEITGVVQWARKGAECAEPAEEKSEEEDEMRRNRAADPETEGWLERAFEIAGPLEWKGDRAECLDLAWLAIKPQYQGKGIGKELVQWGFQYAEKEGITLSVISAYEKDGFYNKLGYTVPSGTVRAGEGNPLEGTVEGGNFWWNETYVKK